MGKACGPASGADKCGAQRSVATCAVCAAPKTCDTAGQCVCVPETDAAYCTRTGKACGSASGNDNCGVARTVASCGMCAGTNVCTTGTCACPETNAQFCTRLSATCGALSGMDSCGNPKSVANCGTCTAPQTCAGGGIPNTCGCTPQTDAAFCLARSKNCELVTGADNCGTNRTANCGACTMPLTCGGGTTTNVCGCSAETNTAFCTRLGKNCGNVTAPDNCGTARTASCGSTICSNSLQSCGGGGVANVCGCPGEADMQFCTRLGKACGSVTANDVCGVSRTVPNCGTCGGFQTCVANACSGRVEPITQVCGGGFCWENPLPVGTPLRGVQTSPTGHNWVVGDSGVVLHWNGATWAGWHALVNTTLRAVWAISDIDVWAVGDAGVILHYDGSIWTPAASGVTVTLNGIWGAPDGTLWVAGAGGTVLKRAPAGAFATQTVPAGTSDLYGVFGIGSDLWIVGNIIMRFNGTMWTTFTTNWTLLNVWGGSTTDVWAVSQSGMMRFNGTTWAQSTAANGNALFGFSTTNVWVVDINNLYYRFDGLGWTQTRIEPTVGHGMYLFGLTGSATDSSLLAVGDTGAIYRYLPSTGWTRQNQGALANTPPYLLKTATLTAAGGEVTAVGYSDLYSSFTDYGTFVRRSNGKWIAEVQSGSSRMGACSASSATNVWALEYSAASRFNGTSWTRFPLSFSQLTSVAAFSQNDAWIVGDDKTLRFNGTSWAAVPNPISTTTVNLYAVAGADATHVWAGGTSGNLLFFDGSNWASVTSGVSSASTYYGIRMLSTTHGLAWGDFGIMKWNGTAWSSVSAIQPSNVWPETTTTYWQSDYTSVSRWNGAALVSATPWRSPSMDFADVLVDGANVWILGTEGELLKKQ